MLAAKKIALRNFTIHELGMMCDISVSKILCFCNLQFIVFIVLFFSRVNTDSFVRLFWKCMKKDLLDL